MLKLIPFILLLPLGVFMFFFGGYDDSPGAQLLGVVMVVIGIVGIVRRRRKSKSL